MIATSEEIKINLNKITVCYEDQGTGEVPILFIHGFPFNKAMWRQQLDALQTNNRVITYDIRGFGESTTDNTPDSMSLYADDLIDLLNALKIEKVIGCGLSMGGYILMNAVNRYPKRFKGIIFSDTQCIADSFTTREKRFSAIEQIREGGISDFTEEFIKNAFSKQSLDSKPELIQKTRDMILSTSPKTIIRALNALRMREEMCFYLNKIMVPVLILCGKEDAVTPLTQSEYMFNKISKATLHNIENAGHLSNLEQPEQFNKYISDFVSSIK